MDMNLKEVLEATIKAWEQLGVRALMERFVVRNGTLRRGSLFNGKRGTPKECFSNAVDLSLSNGLTYVEGYAMRPAMGIPIHHAWCEDEEGRVFDPTWADAGDCQYLGVSFTQSALFAEMRKHEVYGVLDTGRGINTEFMFRYDPELAQIVEAL